MPKKSKEHEEFKRRLVYAPAETYQKEAKELAAHLGWPFIEKAEDIREDDLYLCLEEGGLSLQGGGLCLQGDFTKLKKRLHPANLSHEFLVRAAKIKHAATPLVAVDATAGLGEDAILLAAAGYEVYLFEYNPVIAALLKDALKRAAEDENLKDIVKRMHFTEGDSIEGLAKLPIRPDVILLDPMFPARQKSAQVKRKFQLLHALEMPCANEEELYLAARGAKPRKILVKRPLKGPCLADIKPDYSYTGKAIRYDCLLVRPE